MSGRSGARAISATLRTVVGTLVIGGMALAFAISFVALIYTGPLSDFLGTAIVLALFGAAAMIVLGAWLHALPVVSQPQDATAVLLASGAAAIAATASTEAAGPTTAAFVAVATVATGVLVHLAGRLRFGHAARFMPYPVLGGFLAATGYLLLTGSIGLALDRNVGVRDLPGLADPDLLLRWAPWTALAFGIALGVRRVKSDMVLPLGILGGLGTFYLWLVLTGTPLRVASEAGLLLGPFPSSQFGDPSALAGLVDWSEVLLQLPLIPAVAALAVLGTLLNMSGVEASLGRPTDLDADLRAVGTTNIVSAGTGAFVGYPMIGASLVVRRFGLSGALAAAAIAGACVLCAIYGTDVLALLPRGIFSAVIGFLGLDLLVRWLWEERRSLPGRDLAIVFLMLCVAAFVGFLEAIFLGFAVAAVMFVATYARLDPVHSRSTLAARRSSVERPDTEARALTLHGAEVVILELTGYLFFGSAQAILERTRAEIDGNVVRVIVLDFARVQGLDSSAVRSLHRAAEASSEAGIRLVLTALPAGLPETVTDAGATLHDTLDSALLAVEEEFLASADSPGPDEGGLLEWIEGAFSGEAHRFLEVVHLPNGSVLFDEGAASVDFFVLRSGIMRAEISRDRAPPLVLARMRSGALIGEVAFYRGLARTARVVAETEAELVRIDPIRVQTEMPDLGAQLHGIVAAHLAWRLARNTLLVRQIAS